MNANRLGELRLDSIRSLACYRIELKLLEDHCCLQVINSLLVALGVQLWSYNINLPYLA